MVLIPYAVTYTTTLSGCVPKLVQCEGCGLEYVYLLEAKVSGQGTSMLFLDNEGARQRSAAEAEAVLQQNLAEGCEVVPCPDCGIVQQHMIPRARQLRFRWIWIVGWIALAAAGVIAIPAALYTLIDLTTDKITPVTGILLGVVGALFVIGLGLLIRWTQLARSYDPNNEPVETRKQRGQEIATSKDKFLADSRG